MKRPKRNLQITLWLHRPKCDQKPTAILEVDDLLDDFVVVHQDLNYKLTEAHERSEYRHQAIMVTLVTLMFGGCSVLRPRFIG